MKIIIAPAKKMRTHLDFLEATNKPVFLEETMQLKEYIQTLSIKELQKILGCSDKIAIEAYQMYQEMELNATHITALLAYDGIQYKYMAPDLFEKDWYHYAQKHIRILSGFYGLLSPFDAVVPYRLEINNPFKTPFCKSLYDFWQDKIYKALIKEDEAILDLASAQHSRIVHKYITPPIHYVKCYFIEDNHGILKEKGVYVKMARGAMVRFLCENHIEDFIGVKRFNELGYHFNEELSDEEHYIFIRKERIKK